MLSPFCDKGKDSLFFERFAVWCQCSCKETDVITVTKIFLTNFKSFDLGSSLDGLAISGLRFILKWVHFPDNLSVKGDSRVQMQSLCHDIVLTLGSKVFPCTYNSLKVNSGSISFVDYLSMSLNHVVFTSGVLLAWAECSRIEFMVWDWIWKVQENRCMVWVYSNYLIG